MKFKQYLAAIIGQDGFLPLPHLRYVIQKNPRPTAREEAVAAEVLRQANPRENITSSFPWGSEQQLTLQQLWINPDSQVGLWRNVPVHDADSLYSNVPTEFGELPVPNSIKEPGQIHHANFHARLKDILGEDFE